MNRAFTDEQGRAPEAAVSIADPCATPRRRLLDRLRAARQAWLQVFGIPDYERYLAHLQAHHPGAPMPSVLIGGMSDAALRRTLDHGDSWFLLPVPPAGVADAQPRV